MAAASAKSIITVGGGCFWCIEAIFKRTAGVVGVQSGYAAGRTENPTYKEVCGGDTGHAEVVQITFDPAATTLDKLLDLFFRAHDPTTLNRQGGDVGTQYRSIVLYQNDEEKAKAEAAKEAAKAYYKDPIVTEIEPLTVRALQ